MQIAHLALLIGNCQEGVGELLFPMGIVDNR